ncbi:MAG: hypothetical protein JKY43_10785 [Phycisphaerales bacterium]|nr:hypothetical protein [Phycisphaerales bacterium]
MGIIKRADLESYTRDAVPMDLGDLYRQGQAVIAAAQEQAAQVLRQANQDRQKLLDDAAELGKTQGYESGHTKGLQEGLAKGTEQSYAETSAALKMLDEQWAQAIKEWERDRSELLLHARTEVISLAAQIAARVIKRVIDLDPEVVVDQLETVLETLVTPTDIRIRVHPGDMELLKRVLPAMVEECAACNHADLLEDAKLSPGSCVVSTKGGGEIDASIATQLDRVVATLLPAHRGPEYDQHLEDQSRPSSESVPDSKDDAA